MNGPRPPVTSALEQQVLTPDACRFLDTLIARFAPRISDLLAARMERQARFDAGDLPDFLPETRELRESDWTVSPVPAERFLLDGSSLGRVARREARGVPFCFVTWKRGFVTRHPDLGSRAFAGPLRAAPHFIG